MTTVLPLLDHRRNSGWISRAVVVLVLASLVGWRDSSAARADGLWPTGSRPFGASRVFRAQSPEPFDMPPAPAAETTAPVTLSPLPPGSAESLGLPSLPEPAVKSSPGPSADTAGRPGCRTCGGVGQLPAARRLRGSGPAPPAAGRAAPRAARRARPYEGHSFPRPVLRASLYQSLCCPDPCYEPGWVPAANAAFFHGLRPPPDRSSASATTTAGTCKFPDRSEFFWARQQVQVGHPSPPGSRSIAVAGATGPGRPEPLTPQAGPTAACLVGRLRPVLVLQRDRRRSLGPACSSRSPTGSATPTTAPTTTPASPTSTSAPKGSSSTPSCSCLTVQFRTYTPVGNATYGLGTGHVSLEPSLLAALQARARTPTCRGSSPSGSRSAATPTTRARSSTTTAASIRSSSASRPTARSSARSRPTPGPSRTVLYTDPERPAHPAGLPPLLRRHLLQPRPRPPRLDLRRHRLRRRRRLPPHRAAAGPTPSSASNSASSTDPPRSHPPRPRGRSPGRAARTNPNPEAGHLPGSDRGDTTPQQPGPRRPARWRPRPAARTPSPVGGLGGRTPPGVPATGDQASCVRGRQAWQGPWAEVRTRWGRNVRSPRAGRQHPSPSCLHGEADTLIRPTRPKPADRCRRAGRQRSRARTRC